MLTKETQDALKAELASLNNRATEIEFAKAIILQALGLADKKPLPESETPMAARVVTVTKPSKERKVHKLINKENKESVTKLILDRLAIYELNANEVSRLLKERGIPIERQAVSCFLYRLEKAGKIRKSEKSEPLNTLYTTKGI